MKQKSIILLLCLLFVSFNLRAEKGYKIYPIPQEQTVTHAHRLYLTPTVSIIVDKEVDEPTIKRAKDILSAVGLKGIVSSRPSFRHSNLYLAVKGGNRRAERYCYRLNKSVLTKKGKFDRHILQIKGKNSADIRILGEHCNATFFALASLEQILEQGTKNLKQVLINDYADQQSRGLVEGYYGYPYSIAVKKDLMHFMMRMKMNTYMYGAKSDPYHSEKWEDAYPTSLTAKQIENGLVSQSMLKDLAKTSAETKVNFIWAIHPGNDFVASDDVIERIMHKFTKMYELGIRQFAVFVDDVGVPQTEAECQKNADRLTSLQKAIDTKWNKQAKRESEKVRPLHFVPQVYTLSWVKEQDRKRFYKALSSIPKKITVYFTGRGVWTVPNAEDLETINKDFGRKLAWWWNYPCNDNADAQIFPSDMYYNFVEMPAVNGKSRLPKKLDNGLGIVSNPMQQGEVSKVPLFSVADYAWNNASFDNKASWNASFDYVLSTPEKRQAFKDLIPYLRFNDPEEMQRAITSFKQGHTADFMKLSKGLQASIKVVRAFENSDVETDRLLYRDIKPWLNKLEAMLQIAQNLAHKTASKEERWGLYVQNLEALEGLKSNKAFTVDALEGLGSHISVSHQQSRASSKHLYPFMSYLKNDFLGQDFFGEKRQLVSLIKSKPSIEGVVELKDGNVYFNAPKLTVPAESYVGIEFETPVHVKALTIDKQWAKRHKLYYSQNGKKWYRLKKDLRKVEALRYIIYKNKSCKAKTITWTKDQLNITLPYQATCSAVATPVSSMGAATDRKLGAGCIIDGKPNTFFACNRNQKNGDIYQVMLERATDVKDVRVYFGLVNEDFLDRGVVEVSADGNTWTKLKLKGSTATEAGVQEATKVSSEIAYLDFVGDVKNAQLVRLVLTKAKTNKWLRLYEISVNHSALEGAFLAKVSNAKGEKVTALSDQNPTTSIRGLVDDKLYYHLDTFKPLTAISVYSKASSLSKAKAQVYLTKNGKDWERVGELNKATTLISVSPKLSKAKGLKIEWEKGTKPEIYEIVEQH